MDERRRFERVTIPANAKLYCQDQQGKRLGAVRALGRGGLLLDTRDHFHPGSVQEVVLVSEDGDIRRKLRLVARYISPEGVGFAFAALEPDAAVEVGVIIGKYYAGPK